MKTASLARHYAKALCDSAPDELLSQIRESLHHMDGLVVESHELSNLLNNNTLQLEKRAAILDALLSTVNPPQLLRNFLHLLLQKARISLLDGIAEQYDLEADRRLGRMRGELMVPLVVPEEDVRELQDRLGEVLGKKVVLDQRPSGKLSGGFIVRIAGLVLDASLDNDLARIQKQVGGVEG